MPRENDQVANVFYKEGTPVLDWVSRTVAGAVTGTINPGEVVKLVSGNVALLTGVSDTTLAHGIAMSSASSGEPIKVAVSGVFDIALLTIGNAPRAQVLAYFNSSQYTALLGSGRLQFYSSISTTNAV